MKKHDKGFEDFFRESFEGAEMTPSKHVWENISNRLDGKTQARPTYWWSGGIAAALLLMFCAYIVVYNPFASSSAISNHSVVANQVPKSENNQEIKQKITIKANENNIQNSVTATNDIAKIENNENNKISNKKEITNQIESNTDNKIITKNSNQNKIAIVGSDIENKNTKNKVEKDVLSKVITTKTSKNNLKTTQEQNTNTPNKNKKINNTNKAKKEIKKETNNGINKIVTATTNQVIAASSNSIKNTDELITVDNQLTLLASLGFAIIPNEPEIKLMNVIFVPMAITKTTITKPIIKSKAGFELMFVGSYNSFNPNFSSVKDGVYPNPFVKHSNPQSGNVYDSTLIASGLAKPMVISSYSAGVVFNKNIYKNLGLRTGINYTSISYDIQNDLRFYDPSGASQGAQMNTLHQQTQLVNVPISVFYQQQTGKFVYGLQAGIQADILLSNKLDNDLFVAGNHVYSFGTYNNLNINALAGLRFGYMINSHFSINLEGNYRQALGSVYDTPYLQSNPQSLGLGMGLGYKF